MTLGFWADHQCVIIQKIKNLTEGEIKAELKHIYSVRYFM